MSRLEGEATSAAPPEKVWAVLTDAQRLPEWFWGAKDVVASDGWPGVGGKIAFRVAGGRFTARVVEARAPSLFAIEVDTPSARSRVTSRIEPAGTGARYVRVVEPEWKSWIGPLFGKLFVGPSLRREAAKVAKLAESTP